MKHCGAAYAVIVVAASILACAALGAAVAAHLWEHLRA